jgi:tetratricopeptide (TPR) repeat protein
MSLAQVGGVELTRQAVHLIETGKVRPSMRSLRVLANRLHVPVSALLITPESRGPFDEDAIGDLERLTRHHQHEQVLLKGREILEWARSPELIGCAHRYMGEALCHLDRPLDALEHLQQAEELFEGVNDDGGRLAETMEIRALALQIAEDPRALSVARDALSRFRSSEGQRPEVEARILQRLATILAARREFRTAVAHYNQALQVAGGVRDLVRLARLYHGLAICHHGEGDTRRAAELLFKAHTLYEAEERVGECGSVSDMARVENDIGVMLTHQGDLARAEGFIVSSIQRYEQAGLERRLSRTVLSLAELRQRQGRIEESMTIVWRAIDLAHRLDETQTLAISYKQMGELQAVRGDRDQAEVSFRRALALLHAAGLEATHADCLVARDHALGVASSSETGGGHTA